MSIAAPLCHDSALLFYVMGPSGVGKDSVMDLIRAHWPEQLLIAHRYITRKAAAGGENHVALTAHEFRLRQEKHLFALHWQANGYRYGIGCEVDNWLDKGMDVMVNGSRAHLAQAQQRYGQMLVPIVIDVPKAVLRQRLRSRGRETDEQIELRLMRSDKLSKQPIVGAIKLDNSGDLAHTIKPFNDYYQHRLQGVVIAPCDNFVAMKS